MVSFNQLKAMGTDLLGKAGDMAEQAKEKAAPLAGQAKEKAGPLASKAKGAAAKGVDKAADGLDSATGGKYKGKIDSVSDRLGQKLQTEPLVTPTTVTGVAAGAAGAAAAHHVDSESATTVQVGDVKPDPASPWPEPNDPNLPPATILE